MHHTQCNQCSILGTVHNTLYIYSELCTAHHNFTLNCAQHTIYLLWTVCYELASSLLPPVFAYSCAGLSEQRQQSFWPALSPWEGSLLSAPEVTTPRRGQAPDQDNWLFSPHISTPHMTDCHCLLPSSTFQIGLRNLLVTAINTSIIWSIYLCLGYYKGNCLKQRSPRSRFASDRTSLQLSLRQGRIHSISFYHPTGRAPGQ